MKSEHQNKIVKKVDLNRIRVLKDHISPQPIRGQAGSSSMEKRTSGLIRQDFLEVNELLVKTELLENKTLISESEILERFTQDLMNCKYILLRILLNILRNF